MAVSGHTCYIVTFELGAAGNRPALLERLKSFGGFCPLTANSWAITSTQSAAQVRDDLKEVIGGGRLFVFRSGTEAAWINAYSEKNSEWLKREL